LISNSQNEIKIEEKNNTNINSFPYIILLIFFGLIVYYISNNLLYYYTYGDQYHYRRFYTAIYGQSIEEVPKLQKSYLGGSEPIYGLLIWLGSNLEIDKDVYISFFNSLIAVLLTRWLLIKRVNLWIILLICTNFYFIVILTSAERLKFSYFFILIMLNSESINFKINKKNQNKIFNYFDLTLTTCIILSHFQSIIMLMGYVALESENYYKKIKQYLTFTRFIIFGSLAIVIFSYTIYHEIDSILAKFNVYSSENKDILPGLVKAIGLTIVSVIISSNKKQILFMGGLLSCFVFMLGGDRVNMILVCMIVYAFAEEKKLSHPAMILILFYFSYKSIDFIDSVYEYGDGFYIIDHLEN
jgi:hypothetical protein